MIIDSIKNLYKYKYGENYNKGIFDNDIKKSLSIILSDKQTCISPEKLSNAINKALINKRNIIIKNTNHKIIIDIDKSKIEMYGKTISGLPFETTFIFNEYSFDIENKGEIAYRDSKVICDIPEQFLDKAARKYETSYFHLPDEYKNTDDKVKILYTTAIKSIHRALGTKNLDDADIDWLMEGNKLETSQGFVFFDKDGILQIYSNKDHVITKKTYQALEDKVIYKKQQMTRVAIDEYAHLDYSQKEKIQSDIQRIEVLEQSNILHNYFIYKWNVNIRNFPNDYKIYEEQINIAHQKIKNNSSKISSLKEKIRLKTLIRK